MQPEQILSLSGASRDGHSLKRSCRLIKLIHRLGNRVEILRTKPFLFNFTVHTEKWITFRIEK